MPYIKKSLLLGLVLLAGCTLFRGQERYEPLAIDTASPVGSIFGVVLNQRGNPVRSGTVLLVRDMAPDGVHEREADIEWDGSFRFHNIPSGMYDYVFVFDEKDGLVRRSTLVARAIEVERSTLNTWKILNQRVYWKDVPGLPPSKPRVGFLSHDDLRSLVRNTKKEMPIWPGLNETVPPPLVADVIFGRRANTTLVRNWILEQREILENVLLVSTTEGTVQHTIDLASVYGFNQPSGILTAREEAVVRSVLLTSAQSIITSLALGQLPRDTHAHIALALVASAMEDHQLAKKWRETADDEYNRRLSVAYVQSEYDPATINRAELIALLQYSMITTSDRCRKRQHDLQKIVRRVSHTLTPAERRVVPAAEGELMAVDPSLAFLGLAKTAFAGTDVGGQMHTLWRLAGLPYWMPRGDESILGIVQAAAKMPIPATIAPLTSEKITRNTAILTSDWGTPSEWLVYVKGWNLDVHAGGAPLLKIRSYSDISRPQVEKLIKMPNVDYLMLSGTIDRKPAYRHILFNKRAGYLLISDEIPPQALLRAKVVPARVAEGGFVEGETGRKAQVIALGLEAAPAEGAVDLVNEGTRAALLIYSPPYQSEAMLSEWHALETPLKKKSGEIHDPGHGVVVETEPGGREYVWLSRVPSLVEDQGEDNIIEGKLGVIRRGKTDYELTLIDANWAQCDDLFFKLNKGRGNVTIYESKSASGWTAGPRRSGFLDMGQFTPDDTLMQVDGKYRAFRKSGRKILFIFPRGKESFIIN